ncbi:Os1348 family NHLP clan protein [Comamonas antarctica]|uniref:Uncharacterized protein n=1 Tax=Comamonas antarctica TaxID=2743470 RepID=A0A6N1X503_9BURK|nr:Os1348 family NHLP clan protein [Comamonas antarctica]QKV53948.1 hypothetical protein HUK68_14170 [Comamonas antarctica]
MSENAVKEIIRKAIADAEFRRDLGQDFAEIIDQYNLTDEEKAALKSIDWSKPLLNDDIRDSKWVHIYKQSLDE